MTDNRTTELREKLTERGVEWTKPKSAAEFIQTTFLRNGWGIEVLERNIGLCVTATNVFDTPEQAIAATIGNTATIDELYKKIDNLTSELKAAKSMEQFNGSRAAASQHAFNVLKDEYDRLEAERDAWNTCATGGTLTAEQVRKAIMSADRWEKPMGNTGLTNTHLIIRDDGWQAIADELNAIMGGEEVYVDRAYTERIKPRLAEGTPTEDIRRWSVLAHSVMEVTGPVPFGMDGSVVLWLHETSLTQLLDMCDAVDEKFSEIEQASTVSSEREKALEKLVRSLYADYHAEWPDRAEEMYAERIKELGIEVIDE